jgi:hypothetical protein
MVKVIPENIPAFFRGIFHSTGRIECHLVFDLITVNCKTMLLIEDIRIFNLYCLLFKM